MDPNIGQERPPIFPEDAKNLTTRPVQSQTYLQALLGDTALSPGQFDQVLPTSTDTSPTCTVSASGGSMSASMTNPSFTAAKRNRSVSFSVASSLPMSSPLRSREHASEAGSPTLEQVLLMSRQCPSGGDNGYSLLSVPSSTSHSDLYSSFIPSLSHHQDISPDTSPPHTRPTLSEMVGIDLAVAQAVQNLQKLQQQQAQLYSGLGVAGVPPQVSTPIISDTTHQAQDQAGISILNSILSSVTQPAQQPSYKDSADHHSDPAAYLPYSSTSSGPTDPGESCPPVPLGCEVCEASCTWSGQGPNK